MEINDDAVVSTQIRYKKPLQPPSSSVRPLSSVQQSIFIKDYYVPANFYTPNNLDFELTVRFLVCFLMPEKVYEIKTAAPTLSLSLFLAIPTAAPASTSTSALSSPSSRITTEPSSASERTYSLAATQRIQNHRYPLNSWRYMTTSIMEISQAKFWLSLMLILVFDVVAGEIILRIDPLGKTKLFFFSNFHYINLNDFQPTIVFT